MAWFDVLVQGKVVAEKLAARGRTPNPDTGTWLEIEADNEEIAREGAISEYGRPAFVKRVVKITEEQVLERKKYYDDLFDEEDRRIARERIERSRRS